VASGEPLPLQQDQLQIRGHALEARLYAEDADRGFLPSTGTLRHLRLPANTAHVRVDAGVEQGDAITPFYDPMIAKLIVWDVDRDAALRRMQQALAECEVVGVTTNAAFLRRLVMTDSFTQAKLDTALIEREQAALAPNDGDSDAALWALAAIAGVATSEAASRDARDPHSPWQAQDGWRLGAPAARALTLEHRGAQRSVAVQGAGEQWTVRMEGKALQGSGRLTGDALRVQIGEQLHRATVIRDGNELYLFGSEGVQRFTLHDPVSEADQSVADAGSLVAPMPGRIVATLVAPGTAVKRGAPLLVLEAMKMEHTLQAPADGTVQGYRVKAGDQVGDGAVLVDFEAG
jgi:3-methylcrotonyl-CoA carboxylase alpha subunit